MTLIAETGRCHVCQKLDLLTKVQERDRLIEHWICDECNRRCGNRVYDLLADDFIECCGPTVKVA